MLFWKSLPMWLTWICLLIATIILIGTFICFLKKKDIIGVFCQIASLLGIVATVLGMYHTLFITTYIPSFAPVEYHASSYNEGYYYGFWKDGMPQGKGHLEYFNFSDGDTYTIKVGDYEYRALYYEGEFDKGYRSGKGIVVYEGGYKDEGIFYGSWSEGKKVFEGKRWLINDTFNCYYELETWATSPIAANDKVLSDWISP